MTLPPMMSVDPKDPFLFFGGWPSSFDCDQPLLMKHPFVKGLAPYKTPEHLFQASKAMTLEDHELVRRTRLAREAKARGRAIQLRHDWNEEGESGMPVCYEVMLAAHRLKYRIPRHREQLLRTEDRVIAEISPSGDIIWGLTDKAANPVGKNYLGLVLMTIRDELQGKEPQLWYYKGQVDVLKAALSS